MQVIDPTFRAFAGSLAGRGIWDPLANIFAAIKYAQAVYGPSLMAGGRGLGSGHGYGLGTASALPGWAWVGEFGRELVNFRGGEQGVPMGSRPLPAAPSGAAAQDGPSPVDTGLESHLGALLGASEGLAAAGGPQGVAAGAAPQRSSLQAYYGVTG